MVKWNIVFIQLLNTLIDPHYRGNDRIKYRNRGNNKIIKGSGPNINLQGMLKAITMDEQRMKVTYTRDFGTYIGRLRPMAHGISGSVSNFYTPVNKNLLENKVSLPL